MGKFHDAHRPYASGQGTFDDVCKGIEIAKKSKLYITISVTISNENAHGLAELVRWILQEELHFTLNFYRKNNLADENLSFEDDQIAKGILGAYKEIEKNMPSYSLLDSIVDRANLPLSAHLRTCGVGQNYMVFDPKGHVSKCQMHLFTGLNQKTDQPLEWVQTSPEGIQNISVEEKKDATHVNGNIGVQGGVPIAYLYSYWKI